MLAYGSPGLGDDRAMAEATTTKDWLAGYPCGDRDETL